MPDPLPTQPVGRRRWWLRLVLVAVGFLVLLAGAYWWHLWTIRSAGLELNQKVLAEQAAAGLGSSPSDLIATAPTVDATLQARYKVWDAQFRKSPVPEWTNVLQQAMATSGGVSTPSPADVEHALISAKPALDEVADILRGGNLQLSVLAWVKTEVPDPDKATFSQLLACFSPSLLAVRHAGNGFVCRARAASDSTADLADLDHLVTALDRPSSLIDSMISIAVRRIRDQCYLALEREGRLPASARESWNAAPLDDLRLIADGFRGERLLLNVPLNRMLIDGTWDNTTDNVAVPDNEIPYRTGGYLFRLTFHIANWTNGPGDMAAAFRWLAESEQACRAGKSPKFTGSEDADVKEVFGHQTVIATLTPNMCESAITALHALNQRRLLRLAGKILVLQRKDHALPANEDALVAIAGQTELEAGPSRYQLRYERLTPTRFRVSVDPTVTPDGWPSNIILPRLKGISALGTAKVKTLPALLIREGVIEAEVIAP